MQAVATRVDHKPGGSGDKSVISRPAATDTRAIEDFVTLLAKAARQFHTYPAASPMCVEAVRTAHRALDACTHHVERLELRITATDVMVDDHRFGAGTVIEQELVRRLYRSRVPSIEIQHGASPRDLSRFCLDLIDTDNQEASAVLADILTEHGLETITAAVPQRPHVVPVGTVAEATRRLLDHERMRREMAIVTDGHASYLYPPDKGWIRLDPGESLGSVSLLDMVVLLQDPGRIASVLLRLTGEAPDAADDPNLALERKYSDVSMLFSALDPRLSQVMFGRLAESVLSLAPDRRKGLLQHKILPGLLDGTPDGTVLRNFPDPDLADAICLLLELETAAPEMLGSALNHLDLSADRRESIVPLVQERVRARQAPDDADTRDAILDKHTRSLVDVKAIAGRDFSDFAAFDLSFDTDAAATIASVRERIGATDVIVARLQCVRHLVALEPSPDAVDSLFAQTRLLWTALERVGRWEELAGSACDWRALADSLRERRPDVAEALARGMSLHCDGERATVFAERIGSGAGDPTIAEKMLDAFGDALVPAIARILDDPRESARGRVLANVLCDHAARFGPAIEAALASAGVVAARALIRALGHAGPGREAIVAALLSRGDDQIEREVMRALARMGTHTAATFVANHIRDTAVSGGGAAEEALWHFPASEASSQVCRLLRARDFVLRQPAKVARILDRASKAGAQGLDDGLAEVERLWFRFWNPGVMLLAFKARALRTR
jgi:hypothetical protein